MSEHVTELSADEFAEFTKEGVVLMDFWAPWCGPCKAIAPIVEELAREYAGKLKVGKVNVDDNGKFAQDTYGIMSIPTLLLFKDGQLAEKVVGMRNKAFLVQIIDKLI
ncbi:thioredoxin [Clostridia bacterium]|nr:thioredoxin [Clostridia bacterium]